MNRLGLHGMVFKTFEHFSNFSRKIRGCGGHIQPHLCSRCRWNPIQREELSTSVLYQLEARKGPTFTFIAHHWKNQGSGMVILTHLEKGRKDRWKLSTPQLLQKPLTITSQDLPTKKNNTNPTGDAAGEKRMSGLCFLRRAGRYFSLHLESNLFCEHSRINACMVGGWWHMFFH